VSDRDNDLDDHLSLAQRDIEEGFSTSLTPTAQGWRPIDAFMGEGPMTNGRFTAVPWTYACAHTGTFLGLEPTGREFEIHGVTIVVSDGDEPIFHRYIDWANVMANLGMGATWRPTLSELPKRDVAR
jgi:hypothetical protein